jgi:PAS domain S-box-containing protein
MDTSDSHGFGLADTMLMTAHEGVWIMDADARTAFVSDRMAEMLGCAPSEIVGRPVLEFFDDEAPERRLEALRRGEQRQSQCRFRRKDGSELRALVSSTPIRDEQGNFRGALGMVTDVTAQRKSDEERILILDTMAENLTYLDPGLRIRYLNRAGAARLGLQADEAVGRLCYELRHGRSSPCPGCSSLRALETLAPAEMERETADGRVWLLRSYPILGPDKAVVGVAEFGQEITEARRATESLRDRERLLGAVLDASRNPVIVIRAVRDGAGAILDFEGILGNPAAEALVDHCVGPRLATAHAGVQTQDLVSLYARVVDSGEPVTREICFEGHGDPRWFIVSAVKLRDGAAVTFTDITDRKKAELEAARLGEQVRQSQVMEAAARLATGIGHDLNNLLHSIYASTGLAEARLAPSHPAYENLRHTFTAARAATGLVRRLTAIQKSAEFQPSPLRLNRLFEEYADVLGCIAGDRIVLRLDLRAEPDHVQGVASELEQVLLNLCLNACDAMPAGGRLTVSTGDVTQGPLMARTTGDPGRCFVCLSVSDTGTGMSEEVLDRIFEPLFTTKAPEHGTGLGLPTVRTIVERHGGTIQVESEEGRGTTLRVLLPWWKA